MSSILMRVNIIAVLSAGVALAGLFLPWWGVSQTGTAVGRLHLQWSVWNPPHFNMRIPGATALYWNFALSSISVLALGLIAASLVIVGSLTLLRRYLIAGLVLSALSLGVYAVAVDYVTNNYCVTPLCIQGPIGALSVSGASVNWGFESGFYIFLLAVLLLAAGLMLNRMIQRDNTRHVLNTGAPGRIAVCSQCRASLQPGAKYCQKCGHIVV